MNNVFFKTYAPLLLRWTIGLIFIGASLYKIASPGTFAHQIFNYKLLPGEWINPIAIVLPWLQLFCGVSLLIGWGKEAASLLIALMTAVFVAAVGSALVRGLNISCGCFKAGGSPATLWTLLRDIGLFSLTVWNAHWVLKRSPLQDRR